MHIFNKRGGALPLVIIIISILSILGITLLSITLAEAKQTVYQEKKIQAHYLARTGIEVALDQIRKRAEQLNSSSDKIETVEVLFPGSPITGSLSSVSGFTVTFHNVSTTTEDKVKLVSVGTIQGNPVVRETISLSLSVNIIKDADPKDLGWYSNQGNGSRKLASYGESKYPVVFLKGDNRLFTDANGTHTFKSPAFYFVHQNHFFDLQNKSLLNIYTDYLILEIPVNNNSANGFRLHIYEKGILGKDLGVSVPTSMQNVLYGVVYLDGLNNLRGFYYFPNRVDLLTPNDTSSPQYYGYNRLIKVTDETKIKHPSEIFGAPGTKIKLNESSFFWDSK